MRILIKADIIQFNKETVEAHGGSFVPPGNFLNENSLDYMLEAVNGELFGESMYPTLADKAAFYMFSIVTGHVFQDAEDTVLFVTNALEPVEVRFFHMAYTIEDRLACLFECGQRFSRRGRTAGWLSRCADAAEHGDQLRVQAFRMQNVVKNLRNGPASAACAG